MSTSSERRKSRLSAYYALPEQPSAPPSSSDTPSPPTSSPTAHSPRLSDRQAALDHANSLSRTLTLDKLLSHASREKDRSDSLNHNLNASTRDYYAQLQSAIAAAQNARLVASHVINTSNGRPSPLAAIRQCTQTCTAINDGLRPSREKLNQLDGIRVVHLLKSAAELLATQLPALHAELTLCTDPVTARENMLTAARRYDAVRPAIAHLAQSDRDFEPVHHNLQNAVQHVNHALRDEKIDALTPVECARVRLLLGEPFDSMRDQFLSDAASEISKLKPSQAALTGSACENASVYILYAFSEVAPKLSHIADGYQTVFASQHDVDWSPFLMWAADVCHDSFSTSAEKELTKGVLSQRKGVEKLRDAIHKLTSQPVDNPQIADVLRSVGAALHTSLMQCARRERDQAIAALTEKALSGKQVIGIDVFNAVRQLAEKGEWFEEQWRADQLLRELGQDAVAKGVASGNLGLARAAAFCETVGRAAGDGGKELVAVHQRLCERLLRQMCEQAGDLLRARIAQLANGHSEQMGRDSDHTFYALLELLRQGMALGREYGIESLKGGSGDELFGDGEGLGRCVSRLFVHRIREVCFEEDCVKTLLMDAWQVSECLGVDCFDEVTLAIMERCVDEAAIPSRDEIGSLVGRDRPR